MNLESARKLLAQCREKMDTAYQKPVFDEWVVVSFASTPVQVLSYEGPRAESYKKSLHSDSAPIAREMQDRSYGIGDFEFADAAHGSRFDACVRIGERSYLLCNNTYGTINDLRQDARWLKAQKPFVDLTEKFRADPLS
jgi:hypothetical protein